MLWRCHGGWMVDSKRSLIYLHYWRDVSQKVWFTEFAAYREENKANLPLPLDVQKLKAFQLHRGKAPLTLWWRALPLDPAGAPRPHYRLTFLHLPWQLAFPQFRIYHYTTALHEWKKHQNRSVKPQEKVSWQVLEKYLNFFFNYNPILGEPDCVMQKAGVWRLECLTIQAVPIPARGVHDS